jgi:hypothetical protein
MGVDLLRRIAQAAVLAIYIAAWGVSLWTIVCPTSEHYEVPLELTVVFLLTLGVCSVPELINIYKAVVVSRVKSNGKDKPNDEP